MAKSVVVISPPGERPAIDERVGVLLPGEALDEGWSHLIIEQPAIGDQVPTDGPDLGASLKEKVRAAALQYLSNVARTVSEPPPSPPDIGSSFRDKVEAAATYYASELARAMAASPLPEAGAKTLGRRFIFAEGLPAGFEADQIPQLPDQRVEVTFDELDVMLDEASGAAMKLLVLRRP